MALWRGINQSGLKFLAHQVRRQYVQIPSASSLRCAGKASRTGVSEDPFLGFHRKRPTEFCDNVRFFAAPFQAKQKKDVKDTKNPRMNDQITAQFVRLVTDEWHKVIPLREALEHARNQKLDLVEVQKTTDPPVCKLMDFNREKYKQQVKAKERAKSKSETTLRKSECKEVRFSGKMEQKDLEIKANTVKRLMEDRYRVKCVALGNEDDDLGALLRRFSALIEDVSVVESGPRLEKRQAYVIVRHVKFGLSKKGGARMLKDVENFTPLPRTAKAGEDLEESGGETEVEDVADEDDLPDDRPPLSFVDSANDFDKEKMNASFASFNLHPGARPDSRGANRLPSSTSAPSPGTENRYKRSEPRNGFPAAYDNNVRPDRRDSFRQEQQFSNQRSQPQQQPLPAGGPRTQAGYGMFSPPKANGSRASSNAGGFGENPGFRGPKPGDGQRPGTDRATPGGFGVFSRDGTNTNQNRISKSE